MEKYLSTLSSYPYATVNALNFFFAAGANWVDQGAALLGLPYAVWGTVGLLASVVVGLVFFFKSRDRRAIPLCAALILAGAFCLGVRMHERYMFPALALLLLAAVLYADRRLYGIFAGFSATNAVNIYIVLQNEHVLAENQALGTVVAVLNLALLACLLLTAADLCFGGKRLSADEDLPLCKRQVVGPAPAGCRGHGGAGLPAHGPRGLAAHGRADARVRGAGVLPARGHDRAADALDGRSGRQRGPRPLGRKGA